MFNSVQHTGEAARVRGAPGRHQDQGPRQGEEEVQQGKGGNRGSIPYLHVPNYCNLSKKSEWQ